jgi:MFS family permease
MNRRGLWSNTDYVKFWSGESTSQLGNQVTLLALPLVGVITLHATPFQMGVLNAASYLPFLVLTLFVGVYVDRVRRRPVMVFSAIGRALVLLSIPILFWTDALNMGFLYLAALVLGVLTVLFEVTWQAYLPSLLAHEELVEGNSKLQVTTSAAQVGGPAVGGWMVGLLGAPVALLVDVVTFVVAAGTMLSIRHQEPAPKATGPDSSREPVLKSIRKGLKFTLGNRWLRPCVLEAGTYNMFWLVLETSFLLYAARELHLSVTLIGVVLGGGAVGALIGSTLAVRLADRLGVGPTVSLSMLMGCASPLLIPLAGGPRPALVGLLILSFFIGGAGTTIANIQVVSLRQAITPAAMRGRMNASYRFVSWGTVPVGALLGGWLGGVIGLRSTLLVGALGILASALWIVFSPIRTLRTIPEVPEPYAPEQFDEAAPSVADAGIEQEQK